MDYRAMKINHSFIPKVRGGKAPESQDGKKKPDVRCLQAMTYRISVIVA